MTGLFVGHASFNVRPLARNQATAHPGEHATPLSPTSTIRVIGNAALVQHRGAQETSVDASYFRDGRWHAWYSKREN